MFQIAEGKNPLPCWWRIRGSTVTFLGRTYVRLSSLSVVVCAFLAIGYTAYSAVPVSVDDSGIVGGVACDTQKAKKQKCTASGSGKCKGKVAKCVSASGKKAKKLCSVGGGGSACATETCVSASADTAASGCEKGSKG